MKISFKNKNKILFFRQTKAKIIYKQQIFTARDVKGSPSSQRKMTPHQYESSERMKDSGEGKHMGKYKNFFLIT